LLFQKVAYTTRTITVPSTLSSVADINFNVSLTHSYLSDVEMVISPKVTENYLIGVCNTNSTYCSAMMTQGLICMCNIAQTVVPFQALAALMEKTLKGLV
jgi:hypothetical protein